MTADHSRLALVKRDTFAAEIGTEKDAVKNHVVGKQAPTR